MNTARYITSDKLEQILIKHNTELYQLRKIKEYIDDSWEYPYLRGWLMTQIQARIDMLEISIKSNPRRNWTTSELKFLKNNYGTMTAKKIAETLKRSPGAIQTCLGKNKIRKSAIGSQEKS